MNIILPLIITNHQRRHPPPMSYMATLLDKEFLKGGKIHLPDLCSALTCGKDPTCSFIMIMAMLPISPEIIVLRKSMMFTKKIIYQNI